MSRRFGSTSLGLLPAVVWIVAGCSGPSDEGPAGSGVDDAGGDASASAMDAVASQGSAETGNADAVPLPFADAGADARGETESGTQTGPALYVSPNGSDSNDGSSSAPFATISEASKHATPGTTVHVAAGTYVGDFVTTASGTPSAPITYVSDAKWGARLVGGGGTVIWELDASYVIIRGFDITGSDPMGIYIGWSGTGYGHDNISGNRIHDIAPDQADCNGTGGAAIDTGESQVGFNQIAGNVISNVGASSIGHCNTIQGIYMDTTNDLVVNNLVSGVAMGGIQQWHGATTSIIVNNTVFDCDVGIILGDGDNGALSGGSADNFVANNIVVHNVTAGIDEIGTMGGGNAYANNLLYDDGSHDLVTTSGPTISGTVRSDPAFVDYRADGTGDYHLTGGSPAVHAGTSTNAPSTDIDGTPRSGVPDIGAYAYVP